MSTVDQFADQLETAMESQDETHQLGILLRLLMELPAARRKLVLVAAVALARDRGSITPAENLIFDTLVDYEISGSYLRPDDIRDNLRVFEDNWRSALDTAERFAALVKASPPGGSAESGGPDAQ